MHNFCDRIKPCWSAFLFRWKFLCVGETKCEVQLAPKVCRTRKCCTQILPAIPMASEGCLLNRTLGVSQLNWNSVQREFLLSPPLLLLEFKYITLVSYILLVQALLHPLSAVQCNEQDTPEQHFTRGPAPCFFKSSYQNFVLAQIRYDVLLPRQHWDGAMGQT